jgi:iron complex outermembrane recepter protein
MGNRSTTTERLSLAAAVSLVLLAAQAQAQQGPTAAETETKIEEVVVTGSFIPTLPEDAAIPVEVISYEDLKDLGRPSNLDLIKSLTEVGQVAGEANRGNAFPLDAVTINLRGLGARFTTVVFNGRRFPEQFSPVVGRFNNVASIPNAVIGNIEVLRNGGAAIYGADAVAGVVNYITRKDIKGFEFNGSYRAIDDSDGDYNADGLWGTTFDGGNFYVALAYQHRSKLRVLDRRFTDLEYLENPQSFSVIGNPGSYTFQRPVGVAGTQTTFTPGAGGYVGQRQIGATGVVRDPSCAVLGGFAGFSATPSPVCYFDERQLEVLVQESDTYSVYSELNKRLGESVKLHVEALAYRRDLPDVPTGTTAVPLAFPLSGIVNTTVGSPDFGRIGRQEIAATQTPFFTTPGTNPAVLQFLNTFRNIDGVTSAFTPAQIAAITNPANPGRANLLFGTWRPFGAAGHPLGDDFDRQENHSNQFRLVTQLTGDLGIGEFEWDIATIFQYTKDTRKAKDILIDRLQAALSGRGGPDCPTAAAPGSAGCFFFNPFSSAIPGNIFTGVANPTFVNSGSFVGYLPGQGLQNNLDVIRDLYVPIELNRTYYNYVIDPLVRGPTGWDLPGGPVYLVVGGQARLQTEKTVVDDFSNGDINPCPTLGVTNCVDRARTGVLAFTRQDLILGADNNSSRRFPAVAAFVEAKFPILDNLVLDVVGRYEKFFSDLTDKNNDIIVPAASLKWDVFDWLSFRGSAGKTFSQVNPPRNDGPTISISNANNQFGGFGGQGTNYTIANYDNVDVKSEKGDNFSVGFTFNVGNFRSTVDYSEITINDYTRTLQVGSVLNALLLPTAPGTPRSGASLLNCSSPLFDAVTGLDNRPFIELVGGDCVQGVSILGVAAPLTNPVGAGVLAGGRLNYFGGAGQTNAGELKTAAVDFTASYNFDEVFGGSLTPQIDVTYTTEYTFSDFLVGGIKVADGYNGIGDRNSSTGRLGQGVPEYQVAFNIRYRNGDHTLSLQTRYIPTLVDDDTSLFDPTNPRNGNIGDANGNVAPTGTPACAAQGPVTSNNDAVPPGAGTGAFGGFCANQNVAIQSGRRVESYFNLNAVYRWQATEDLEFSLNVNNVLDDDPSFARGGLGYDPGFGSPLGRTVQLSSSFKF